MDLFITKVNLKNNVTKENIWNLIKKWLIGSPHYNIDCVPINFKKNEICSQKLNSSTSIFLLESVSDSNNCFAVRFELLENKVIWNTDFIFSESKEKYLSIKVSCESNDYSKTLPDLRKKPHIIKMLFDYDYCDDQGYFPILDKPIILQNKDINKCAEIIKGEVKSSLPVIYISYDPHTKKHYAVNVMELAKRLSGMAHVLVEPNNTFSLDLRKKSNYCNAYNGYIGIYFPGTTYREIIRAYDFNTMDKLMNCIQETVLMSLLNYAKVSDLTWDKLQVNLLRNRFLEQKNNVLLKDEEIDQKTRELEEFIKAADAENNELEKRIDALMQELNKKSAIIESLKNKNDSDNFIKIKLSESKDYYIGEIYDFVINILQQCKGKFPKDGRQEELLEDILRNNDLLSHGKEMLNSLEEALKEKNLDSRRRKLRDCGFTVIVGSHDKIKFKDNSKYMFTLSNSPSDCHTLHNSLSDIKKKIDIYRKLG